MHIREIGQEGGDSIYIWFWIRPSGGLFQTW